MVSLLSGHLPGGKVKPMSVIAPYITSCYESSRFCDLVLITMNNKWIYCHKIVLCSLSPDLGKILAAGDEDCGTTNVHLPECTFQEVKTLVDKIYASIGKREVELQKSEVTAVLGINDGCVKREARAVEDEDDEPPAVEVEIKAEVSDGVALSEEEPLKMSGNRRGRPKKRKRGRPPKSKVNYNEDSVEEDEEEEDDSEPLPRRKIKRETLIEHDIFEDANEIDEMDYEPDGWQIEDGEALETRDNVSSVPSGHTVPKKMRKLFGRPVQEKKKKPGRPKKGPACENLPSAEELLALESDPEVLELQEAFAAEVELWRPKPRLKRGPGRPKGKPTRRKKRNRSSEDEDEIPLETKTRRSGRPDKGNKMTLETNGDKSDDSSDDDDEEYSPEVATKVEKKDENTKEDPKHAPDPDLLDIVSQCRPVRFNVKRLGDDFPVMPDPNRPWRWFIWSQLRKPAFAALVGVAHSQEYIDPRILKFNGEMLVGRPLAWSFPNGREQMEDHYNAVTEAYIKVFGFSEEDVYCNQLLINRAFGGCDKTPAEYKDIRRTVLKHCYEEFKDMEESELRYLLERRRAERPLADERREKKPTLKLKFDRCKLRFDPTLQTENFEGVMLIAWHNNSNTDGHPVGRVLNFDHDVYFEEGQSSLGGHPWIWSQKQLKAVSLFIRILKDVWGNGDDKYRLPLSANICSR